MKKNQNDFSSWPREKIKTILLKMKLLTLLIFAGTMAYSASSYSQKTKIDLQVENSSLTEILSSIEKRTEYIFIYNAGVVNAEVKKSISVQQESIESILNDLFEGMDISYKIDDRQVFIYKNEDVKQVGPLLLATESEQPAKKAVSGKVTDEKGMTLPGVSVIVKGTTIGMLTDPNGGYTI